MSTHTPAPLHPDDTYTEPTVRDRVEGLNFTRGFLFGAATSVPVWAVIFSIIGIVAVVTR